jgi:hypothetical protein
MLSTLSSSDCFSRYNPDLILVLDTRNYLRIPSLVSSFLWKKVWIPAFAGMTPLWRARAFPTLKHHHIVNIALSGSLLRKKVGIAQDLIRGSSEASGDPRVKYEEDNDGREAVINSILHRASVWFKALDLVIDSARLVQEPTMAQTKKLTLDYAHLQGMVSGVNGYSVMIGVAETMYQLQLGEYRTAFSVAAGTVSAMALPVILAMANRPYLGFAYGAWIATSTTYGAITNAYSFATEIGSSDLALRSATSYKDLAEWFAASPAQALHDFVAKAKEYKLQINDLLFEKEKSILQTQIKGEFGQKVFDYIYLPELLEKYVLLNGMTRGELTEEEAQSLKSKSVAISYGALKYDRCVRTENSRDEASEYYYCCNTAGQILDHVVLTGGRLEVLENL